MLIMPQTRPAVNRRAGSVSYWGQTENDVIPQGRLCIPTYWVLQANNPISGGVSCGDEMAFDYIPVWSSKKGG